MVRHVHGRRRVIELPGRVVTGGPRSLWRGCVVGDRAAAVARVHDVLGIVRIDPEIVRIAAAKFTIVLPPSVDLNVPTFSTYTVSLSFGSAVTCV